MARQRGFTLVEVMVALSIMALMGSMSWVGLSALLESRERTHSKSVDNAQLQIALTQWANDLDQAWMPEGTQPMGWDGKAFRLTRRAQSLAQGVVVIAWAVRAGEQGGQWMRWQSQPVSTMAQWRHAWEQAANWARGAQDTLAVSLMPATSADVYLWQGQTWVNAQSSQASSALVPSGATPGASTVTQQPGGVRLVVHTRAGDVTKDWVSPMWSESRS